jgi:hypothetical protein
MLKPAASQQRGGADIRRLVGEQEPGETRAHVTLCLQAGHVQPSGYLTRRYVAVRSRD